MKKLPRSKGLSLIVARFNLLECWHSHKNYETFYPFFFLSENFPYFCDYDDSAQIWRSKLQHRPLLKNLVQLLICNVFLTVM